MAVTYYKGSRTIRGIKYDYGDKFTCYASNGGAATSEGSGSAADLTKGTSYYYLGYAIDDDNDTLTSYPYAVGTSSSTIRGWYKANVFPYATYTISYNANGGSGAPSYQTKTYGTNLTLRSEIPTRNGYTFKCWNREKDGSGETNFKAGGTYTGNSDITLYAQWTPITYNVTINLGGGTGVSSRTYTVETASFTLGTPTRNGYTFLGWTGSNGTTAQKSVSIVKGSTGNKTYTANWSENALTINYYSNYADYGTYKGESLNVSANTNVKVHSQDFLYDNSYSSALSNVQNVDYLYLLRTGYTPTGYWGTLTTGGTLIDEDADYSTGQALAQAFGKSLISGNASVNVYPQWKINTYIIGYDGNGGYGSMEVQSVDWQETFTLFDNKFEREGYKFVGWNVQREADRKWYVNGQGWLTEDEISTDSYEKKLYLNQDELIFDLSWIKGETGVIHQYTMYAVWEVSGVVYIDNGITFEPYLVYIDNGIDWDLYLMYIDDGTNWNIMS